MRQNLFDFINRLTEEPDRSNQSGQGLLEYIIIIALVGIAVIGAVSIASPAISNTFERFVDAGKVAPPSLANYTPPPPTAAEPSPTPDVYNITISINSEAGSSGSTNPPAGTHLVPSGKTFTLTATTTDHFLGWTGDINSPHETSYIAMDEERFVTANFRVNCYTLDAAVSIGSVGNISQSPAPNCAYDSNKYRVGSVITLTADIDPEVDFYGWTSPYFPGSLDTNPQVTITLVEDTKVRANYESKCHTLSTHSGANGSIGVSFLPGAECPDGSAHSYAYNARGIFTSNPDDSHQFDHWEYGPISGTLQSGTDNPFILYMTDDLVVNAFYTEKCLTINKIADGGTINTVSPLPECGGSGYRWNTKVTFQAIPDSGMNFTSWSGDAVGSALTTTVYIRKNIDVIANFGGCHALTVNANGAGSVSQSASNGECGAGYYPDETLVTLTANPDGENDLLNWNGDIIGDLAGKVVQVIVDGDKTVTANFEACYTLTTAVNGSGTVTDNGTVCSTNSSKYAPQTTVAINANPADGNRFTSWSGDLISEDNPAEISMNGNESVTAAFVSCAPLPGVWTNNDINAAAGSSCYENVGGNETFTIIGAGNGIAGTTDGFRFAHQEFSGDGYIIVHVDSQENTHDYAKAGIMLRDGTGSQARNVYLAVTPNQGIRFQWRTANGSAASGAPSVSGHAPVWLRLDRNGDAFTASYSTDKVNWTVIRTQNIAMPTTLRAGLAVTSRNNEKLSEAVFTGWDMGVNRSINVTVAGQGEVTITPPNTVCPPNCTVPALDGDTVTLTPAATAVGFGFTGWSGDAGCTGSPIATLTMNKSYNCTATFALTCDPVPSGWTAADIGNVGATGHTCYTPPSNESFIVNGSGANIWGDHDAFQYAYRQWSGDGTITAYLVSQEDTGDYAKAGVMFRDTLNDGSVYAMTSVTPDNGPGTRFQYRGNGGGSLVSSGSDVPAPVWIRVVRVGNTFTGYRSADGSNWTLIESVDITMADPIYVGLAVTAFDYGTLSSVVFTDVTVTSP